MTEQVFNDRNEPFWRSAEQIELGSIPGEAFASYILQAFKRTGRLTTTDTIGELLALSNRHPYGTQELAYSLWEKALPALLRNDLVSDAPGRPRIAERLLAEWTLARGM